MACVSLLGLDMKQATSATNQFYQQRNSEFVYPVEFVVRALMGNYPLLKLDKAKFPGSKILDVGYGDGRNMPLLFNLGFDVYGIEISEEINELAQTRLAKLGVSAQLKQGRNAGIPFEDGFFDFVLACHSCYYIDPGTTFDTVLDEVSRVLSPRGVFICSLPMHDTYILEDAERLGDGYYKIVNDPYGYRKDTVFRAFTSKEEVMADFDSRFDDIYVGFCDDDFFGVRQKVWTVVCKKRAGKESAHE